MEAKSHLVSVKTMTDYHLEEFLKCPYRFYYQRIMGNKSVYPDWRQVVQYVVNQVVNEFFKWPSKNRSSLTVFHLIDKFWVKKVHLFESKIHYYTILAKVTDHLLKFLLKEETEPPLFLFEKLNTKIDELQLELALTIQVAEWSDQSFVIKKYFVDDDTEILTSFKHLMILFSKKAFGVLPESIEVVSLLSGKLTRFYPKDNDVDQAIEYLYTMKDLLRNPENYHKSNTQSVCRTCSFKDKCYSKFDSLRKEIEL